MDMGMSTAVSVSRGDIETTEANQILAASETLLNGGLKSLATELGRRFLASGRHGPQGYALPTIARPNAWRDRAMAPKAKARRQR